MPKKAPQIPNPIYRQSTRTMLQPASFDGTLRRSPRFQNHSNEMHLAVDKLTSLGCKGWRATLTDGRPIFAKLWDGWKFSSDGSEHEAAIYYRLKDLWNSIVPNFLGFGDWGFCHILLLSHIDVPTLYSLLT